MAIRNVAAAEPRQFSDDAVAAAAAHAIQMDRGIPGGVHVRVEHGEAVISGTVHSSYQKQEAEDVVRHVHGVRHVTNQIEVTPGNVEPPDESC